jgi:hypothetical protein
VFSELGTKKQIEIQCFRDFVVLGRNNLVFPQLGFALGFLLLVAKELGIWF